MQRLLDRLQGVVRRGSGIMARCPAHEDKSPSLSISRGDDGRTLVNCHAGCKAEDIVKAAGLTMADLFPVEVPKAPRRIVKVYAYRLADGAVVFEVVRYEPKDFRQRRSDGNGGYVWSLANVPRPLPLYRLPELLAADKARTVFLCAGEKDADNVAALGFIATTKAAGEKNWKDADSSPLHGRKLVILPDKDKTGREYAAEVAADLKGRAVAVRLLEFPGEGVKDVSDWIEKARSNGVEDAAISAEIIAKVKAAPEWTPAPPEGDLLQPAPAQSELTAEFMAEQSGARRRVPLPWKMIDRLTHALRPGNVTIVGGPAGYGKSFFVQQIAIHAQGKVEWALLPLEGKRSEWERRALAHLAQTWEVLDDAEETAGQRMALAEQYRADLDALISNVCENPTLAKLDEKGRPKVPGLPYQDVLDWAAKALQTKRLVIIDPLAKIEFPGFQPWAAEKDFVRQLVGITSHSGGSVILVVHTVKRTGAAAAMPLTAEDLQGAAELNRLVDAVLLLETHSPRESTILRAEDGCRGEVTHSRTLAIGKARHGSGMGMRVAIEMHGPSFEEIGTIVPQVRKVRREDSP
jgi:hypothetical protein